MPHTPTYAGVGLSWPTADFAAWAEANLSLADVCEFPAGLARGGQGWARLLGSEKPPPVRLAELDWPNGASRFALSHWVVTQEDLDLIRPRVYVPYRPALLAFDDGDFAVTVEMWMLPPRPVQQKSADLPNVPYLLTLVDERYFWWDRAAEITVDAGTTTWVQLYAAIATGLDIDLTVDAIPAAYLTPPAAYTASYENLPSLLDEVAEAVGQRIVRDWRDGSVRAMNVAESRTRLLANLGQHWPKAAGGELAVGWT